MPHKLDFEVRELKCIASPSAADDEKQVIGTEFQILPKANGNAFADRPCSSERTRRRLLSEIHLQAQSQSGWVSFRRWSCNTSS